MLSIFPRTAIINVILSNRYYEIFNNILLFLINKNIIRLIYSITRHNTIIPSKRIFEIFLTIFQTKAQCVISRSPGPPTRVTKGFLRRERIFIYQDDDLESNTSDTDFVTSLSIKIEYFKANH